MDAVEIRRTMVRACMYYRDFIEIQQRSGNRRSGTVSNTVKRIDISDDGTATLRLDRRMGELDSVFLTIGDDAFFPDTLGDIQYDDTERSVTIRPDRTVLDSLRDADRDDVRIVSDIKWLIDSACEFYKRYGDGISYPRRNGRIYDDASVSVSENDRPSDEQMRAIRGILNDRLSYVWGTPGAGKTQYVLATAIMSCIAKGERVAVIAPTNTALEQVLRGLLSSLSKNDPDHRLIDPKKDILRLGNATRPFAKDYPDICESRMIEEVTKDIRSELALIEKELSETNDAERRGALERRMDECASVLDDINGSGMAGRLDDVKIVAMTPQKLMMRFSPIQGDDRPCLDVDRFFLDEAGYTSVVNTLPLFAFGVPIAMLGDHMQLPPVCEIDGDTMASFIDGKEEHMHAYPWRLPSMFAESFLTMENDGIMKACRDGSDYGFTVTGQYNLTRSYRFGPNLASILDEHVYGGIGLKGMSDDRLSIEVIDTVSTDRDERYNVAECRAILSDIMEKGLRKNEYAILTPYNKQAYRIRKELDDMDREYNVFTIHKSQGKEWDTVYLSVVDNRTELEGKDVQLHMTSTVYSRDNVNTLNTAISRAKRRLVIVCDAEFWKGHTDELICRLIGSADSFGTYRYAEGEGFEFTDPNGKGRPRVKKKETLHVPKPADRSMANRIYAAMMKGHVSIPKRAMNHIYDYAEMTVLRTESEVGIQRCIETAYSHLRSGSYKDAQDSVDEMIRIYNISHPDRPLS
ncbi:MAG: DEAD/DEAH box helicase [Candidatus Methanomethylophilaceae archaeon]